MKIIVEIEGGICTAVYADSGEPVEVEILDHDDLAEGEELAAQVREELVTGDAWRQVF